MAVMVMIVLFCKELCLYVVSGGLVEGAQGAIW
jgi:hypothetical protein